PAGLEDDLVAEPQRRMVIAQVDADHEAAAAHLGDLGHLADLFDQLAEQPDLGLQAEQRALALEGVQAREGGRAGERAAGEGVAVEEGPPVLRRAAEKALPALARAEEAL